jgi:hypothetical protein
MKTLTLFGDSHARRGAIIWTALALGCALSFQVVSAQESSVATAATNVSSTAVSNTKTGAVATTVEKVPGEVQAGAVLSPAVQDILKMSDAGVSAGIIVSFIQNTRISYVATAPDLIELKRHNVPDEVTSALMQRGAEIEAQTAKIKQVAVTPTVVRQLSRGTYADPESYDFWYKHYAYPRALSYSYRNLGPGPGGYRGSYGRHFR